MTREEELHRKIAALKLVLNSLIASGAPYKKIYFVSLLIDKLSNQLYFFTEKKA